MSSQMTMFKQSSLLKWAKMNKYVNKTGKRLWVHPPEVLKTGHVAYLVKFLGKIEVNQPIGTEVVRQGVNQLRLTHSVKKSTGGRIQRVELTISVDGVTIQDFKTKEIFYRHPLHRISYCADDNTDKRFISFIAQEETGKHSCFVFFSNKRSKEITLTIGQAFDLAYSRFMDSSGRDMEMKKNYMILKKKTFPMELSDFGLQTHVGDTIENLSFHNTGDFNARTEPVPLNGINHIQNEQIQVSSDETEKSKDLFGAEPFIHLSKTNVAEDPFGMGKFNSFELKPQELDNGIGAFDKRISEMKDDFSSGCSFGNEDFLLESLDPLYNKTS
ncbi:PTB domain-containing engulfment adapter protein 1-like isoform X2 [Limulus polyphemus]|uniref:PTB domain-containing engulfment adapter protein 1-like isoform X2 n=1 Tax=Limulus polyphemus TaxID=6850 RepID=A0ABM1RV68_LIMPO|nr:PTB domain-containing engulfment adapter protein 1-like isoform X2 [Limulus polyphemus]